MEHEPRKLEEPTAEQFEAADFFIAECGLGEVAGTVVEAYGVRATVRWGLARSSNHLLDLTNDEIRDMVYTKIAAERDETVNTTST